MAGASAKTASTRTLPCALAVAAALYIAVPIAFAGNLYLMSLVVAALTIGGVALAWALLGNLGGLVSFGHAAFFGVGSYASAILVMKAGWPIAPAMLAGGACAALSAVLVLPALRLRGPYFALAVLAYAHIFRIVATEWKSLTNGAGGIGSIPRFGIVLGYDLSGKTGAYWIALTIVLAFALCYRAVRASDYGLALSAMHDSEDATRAVGVDSTLLKALMLFLSAFMTGVMGAFNAHYINFLEPDYAFSGQWTMLPIVAAIFGGYRTITGPLVGAVVVYLVDQLVFKAMMPIGHQIMLGALLGAMILCSPGGLVPVLARRLRASRVLRWRDA
ncbi:MAG: branched-chain amino acid ABC transporter permease [Betaproteobacteria bacterium]